MSAKNTPGPWSIDPDDMAADEGSVFTIGIGTDDTNVATVSAFTLLMNDDGSVSPGEATQSGLEEARANARLIAAAPDLLQAAEAAWQCIGELPPTQARVEVAQMLQAAIAKATGGAS